jgi:hypothetical protein
MKSVVLVAAMLVVPGLLAQQGMVETRDGKTVTGQVQFDTNQLIVVNANEGLRITIPLIDVLGASFQAAARSASSPGEDFKDPAHPGALPEPWQNVTILPENENPLESLGGNTEGRLAVPLFSTRPQARFLYGVFQVDAVGTNIDGTADSCHFVFKTVKGDTEIMTRVLHVPNTSPWAKAGLMMRQSLRSDSPNIFFAAKPTGGGVLQWRDTSGGETTVNDTRSIGVPFWLKLKRSGNTFTAYGSRSGRQWRVVQSFDMPMTDEIYVGLAVAGLRNMQPANSASGTARPQQFQHCSFDQIREASYLPSWFVPRIELQNGSLVLGQIASANDERIVFDGGALGVDPLPTPAVANILFQWVPTKTQGYFEAGRTGVILTGGQFVESQFKGIQTGRLKMSSDGEEVRNYDLTGEAMALVLRKSVAQPQTYEVQTLDGSVWLGENLEVRNNIATMDTGASGVRTFHLVDLRSIRRLKF